MQGKMQYLDKTHKSARFTAACPVVTCTRRQPATKSLRCQRGKMGRSGDEGRGRGSDPWRAGRVPTPRTCVRAPMEGPAQAAAVHRADANPVRSVYPTRRQALRVGKSQ
jgi:hypothetical protein